MQFFSDIPAALAGITGFAVTHAADLPAGAAPLFVHAASQPSPVDTIVKVAECLYASQAGIAAAPARSAAQALAAQCAAFAAQYGWHDMGARGGAIAQAMRRELGEPPPAGLAWPAPPEDPPVKPEWSAAPAANG